MSLISRFSLDCSGVQLEQRTRLVVEKLVVCALHIVLPPEQAGRGMTPSKHYRDLEKHYINLGLS